MMRMRYGFAQKFVALALSLLISGQAFAAPRLSMFDREKQNINPLSEYIYGDEVEQKLTPVYLLGAVAKPGLYHVPVKTNLTTLLAIAGGPTKESELDEVVIRNEETQKVEKVDYEKLMTSADAKSPVLSPKDVVLVSTKDPSVSGNTMVTLSFVATLLTVVMTGILIKKEL